MFISSGNAGGKKIKAPSAKDIRPTSQMVKEALFDILRNEVSEADFLDLFAGFGTVGVEALSRGAQTCTFIDRNRYALSIIRENLQIAQCETRAKIIYSDSLKAIAKLQKQFDIIFVDPPYDYKQYTDLITQLAARQIIREKGVIVIEHYHKTTFDTAPYTVKSVRKYGQTALTFIKEE